MMKKIKSINLSEVKNLGELLFNNNEDIEICINKYSLLIHQKFSESRYSYIVLMENHILVCSNGHKIFNCFSWSKKYFTENQYNSTLSIFIDDIELIIRDIIRVGKLEVFY